MTAAPQSCQPEAAAPYQHVCPDVDCCYHGQPSFRGCGCYRTREQMMSARIEELTKALKMFVAWDDGTHESSPAAWHDEAMKAARRTLATPLEQDGSAK